MSDKSFEHTVHLPADSRDDPEKILKETDVRVENPCHTYDFELDPFQRKSVELIDQNQNVMVAAHTSAGKTAVAEYSIAKALKNGAKVIYTSPIKALSNQKYFELSITFGDVGLITGDNTISPNAKLLIMTTEILRNMLYRGSLILEEVSAVIFDEIHYMNDKDRGVIWEESIILLDDNVNLLFLSATVPNGEEFCSWVANIHNRPCHLVRTYYRPVPLSHYIYNGNSFELALASGKEPDLDVVRESLAEAKNNISIENVLNGITKTFPSPFPILFFVFSKKKCEKYVMEFSSSQPLNTEEEMEKVELIFESAIRKLPKDSRDINQIAGIKKYLKIGYAMHHSGLLPFIKELIEIMFAEGLIKVLFATETFSMGLNMPAKTVVFPSLRKYTGPKTGFRPLEAGEYIQMSGRAGRRGIDKTGTVVFVASKELTVDSIRDMLSGEAKELKSSFRYSYNTLLSVRRGGNPVFQPEDLLKKSFFYHQEKARIMRKKQEVSRLEAERIEAFESPLFKKELEKYKMLSVEYEAVARRDREEYLQSKKDFLKPGKILILKKPGGTLHYGVIVPMRNLRRRKEKRMLGADVAIYDFDTKRFLEPERVEPLADVVFRVSKVTLTPVKPGDNILESYTVSFREVLEEFSDRGLPYYHESEGSNRSKSHKKKVGARKKKQAARVLGILKALGYTECEDMPSLLEKVREYEQKRKRIDELESEIRSIEDLRKRMVNMNQFLIQRGYVSQSLGLTLKGTVACEITSSNMEIYLAEIFLGGAFETMNMEEIAALLSIFVFGDIKGEDTDLSNEDKLLVDKYFHPVVKDIYETLKGVRLETKKYEDFIKDNFSFVFMPAVRDWVKGMSLNDLLKNYTGAGQTQIYEGDLIKGFRGILEVLKQLMVVARLSGTSLLEEKFSKLSLIIRRSVVDFDSLYLV